MSLQTRRGGSHCLAHPLLHRRERAYVLITQLVGGNVLEGVLKFRECRGNLLPRSGSGQPASLG